MIEVDVAPGDKIYIATDGAFDQLSQVERKRFRRSSFEQLLLANHHSPIEEQQQLLAQELLMWQGQAIQTDDITVLGFVV